MSKLIDSLKENAATIITLICLAVAGGISWGSSQATASVTFASHETRLNTLEEHDREYNSTLAGIKQHVDDLWRDNGHSDQQ